MAEMRDRDDELIVTKIELRITWLLGAVVGFSVGWIGCVAFNKWF